MKKTTCFDNGDTNKFSRVTLEQTGLNRFTVTYGLQVKRGLSYGDAATELGECLMHRAACDGMLYHRMPGER